jgi:hypothetical protein
MALAESLLACRRASPRWTACSLKPVVYAQVLDRHPLIGGPDSLLMQWKLQNNVVGQYFACYTAKAERAAASSVAAGRSETIQLALQRSPRCAVKSGRVYDTRKEYASQSDFPRGGKLRSKSNGEGFPLGKLGTQNGILGKEKYEITLPVLVGSCCDGSPVVGAQCLCQQHHWT